jgi:hypothetical protein
MRSAAAFLTLFAWSLVPAPASAQVEPSQCISRKYKAATVYAQKLGACKAKARAREGEGLPDPACLEKALAGLQKVFTKAEGKGDCKLPGDADLIALEVDQLLDSLQARLERAGLCCSTAAELCFYTADIGDCASFQGVPGLPGDVCGPTGECGTPPALPGACCDAEFGFNVSCAINPAFTEPACTAVDGTFHPNASCTPDAGCVVPVP